jgi:hypothetical protein
MRNLISVVFLLFSINCSLFTISSSAQSKAKVRDTFLLRYHSPTKATLLSVVLPGAGQAYNHKYWKIPIIYAGVATIIYFVNFNGKYYRDWRNAYSQRLNYLNDSTHYKPDQYIHMYSPDQLKELRDYYNKDLQLTYIIAAGLYILNILDAAVDANLYDYDISDKLSLHAAPNYNPTYDKNFNFAMTLTYKF